MHSSFSRVSLAIFVEEDYYPPNRAVLEEPRRYNPKKSRIVLHETLHYWQQFRQFYMTRVAEEEWEDLLDYRSAGILRPEGPRLRHYVEHIDPKLGITPWKLHEALTRYWDLHICDPNKVLAIERDMGQFEDSQFWDRVDQNQRSENRFFSEKTYSHEEFGLAMEGPAGQYAEPYLHTVDTSGLGAAVIFPIAAHFAMKTTDPVSKFFEYLELLAENKLHFSIQETKIEILWEACFMWFIANCDTLKVDSIDVRDLSFPEHEGYHHGFNSCLIMENTFMPDSDIPWILNGEKKLDFIFAFPGIGDNRFLLCNLLPPPVVMFANDPRLWTIGHIFSTDLTSGPAHTEETLSYYSKFSQDIQKEWIEALKKTANSK